MTLYYIFLQLQIISFVINHDNRCMIAKNLWSREGVSNNKEGSKKNVKNKIFKLNLHLRIAVETFLSKWYVKAGLI